MEALLLEGITNLVVECVDPKSNSELSPINAAVIKTSSLLRVLLGLAAIHQQLKRGTGNITDKSLKLNANELVLVCNTFEPSLCKTTQLNATEARRWKNVGGQPQQSDDLVSLGVAIAEIVIPPKNRPAATQPNYRDALAKEIDKAKTLNNPCKKIVKGLLLSDQHGIDDSAQFVRRYMPLQVASRDARLEPAGWSNFVRHHPLPALSGLAVPLVLMFAFWTMWQREFVKRVHAEQDVVKLEVATSGFTDEVSSLTAQVSERDKKIEQLEVLLKTSEQPTATPSPPIIIEVLTKLEIFQIYKDDPYIAKDNDCKRILRKGSVSPEEWQHVVARLKNLDDAAKQWWEFVDEGYSKEAIDSWINAADKNAATKEVASVLAQWIAAITPTKKYTITVDTKNSHVANGYEGYSLWLSVKSNGLGGELYPVTIAPSPLVTIPTKKPSEILLEWNSGKPIELLLKNSGYAYWETQIDEKLTGYLALNRLAKTEFFQNGFALEFDVNPLPGPPLASTSTSLTIPSTPGSKTSLPTPRENGGPSKASGAEIEVTPANF